MPTAEKRSLECQRNRSLKRLERQGGSTCDKCGRDLCSGCDYDHEKMKYGGEKYDKYSGHGNDYDQKKMMTTMMKDKEY